MSRGGVAVGVGVGTGVGTGVPTGVGVGVGTGVAIGVGVGVGVAAALTVAVTVAGLFCVVAFDTPPAFAATVMLHEPAASAVKLNVVGSTCAVVHGPLLPVIETGTVLGVPDGTLVCVCDAVAVNVDVPPIASVLGDGPLGIDSV